MTKGWAPIECVQEEARRREVVALATALFARSICDVWDLYAASGDDFYANYAKHCIEAARMFYVEVERLEREDR